MRRRADFDRVFQDGRHNSSRLLAVRSIPNQVGTTRFGYVVSKRVGKAVVRNRVRRRLREIARALRPLEGFDVVLTARPEAATAGFQALKAEAELLFKRARLLRPPPATEIPE